MTTVFFVDIGKKRKIKTISELFRYMKENKYWIHSYLSSDKVDLMRDTWDILYIYSDAKQLELAIRERFKGHYIEYRKYIEDYSNILIDGSNITLTVSDSISETYIPECYY